MPDIRSLLAVSAPVTTSVATGVYAQPNDLVEHDTLVLTPAANQQVDVELDMSNLTQQNTVREYVQVDGANYREISAKVYPVDFDAAAKSITLSLPQANSLYKITMQSSVLEGGAKNVPYRAMKRVLT